MGHHEINFSLQRFRRDLHVQIGLAKIAIPFRDLVFEDAMIAERVPGEPIDLAMVLMGVVATVRENNVRPASRLQRLEPAFDGFALLGKKTCPEVRDLDLHAPRPGQKILRRRIRLIEALSFAA
jgi:hypothetical protein